MEASCTKATFAVTPRSGSYAEVKKMYEEIGTTLLASPFLPGGKRYEKWVSWQREKTDVASFIEFYKWPVLKYGFNTKGR